MSQHEFGKKLKAFIEKHLECEDEINTSSVGIYTPDTNFSDNQPDGSGYSFGIMFAKMKDKNETLRLVEQFIEHNPELKGKIELKQDKVTLNRLNLYVGDGYNDYTFDTENANLIDQALAKTMDDKDFKFTPTRSDCLVSHNDAQPLGNIMKPTGIA